MAEPHDYSRSPDATYMMMDDCIDGHLYALASRNLVYGVYRAKDRGFIGIREKFGQQYLFTEYHYDIGTQFGTAQPLIDLGPCPISDLREYVGSYCTVHGLLVRRETGFEHHRSYQDRKGERGSVVFTDYHADDGSPVEDGLARDFRDPRPEDADGVVLRSNDALFEWLEDAAGRLDAGDPSGKPAKAS